MICSKILIKMTENTEIIEAYDINGELITIGSYIIYINTGTSGKVIDIKKDDANTWVLMDKTNLYYNITTVILTDESTVKVKIEHEEGIIDKTLIEKEQETEKIVDIGQVTGGG